MSLKPGDYIDALAKYKTPSSNNYHFIQGWARARVLDADENSLTVGFLGRSRANNSKLLRQSEQIAPLKKYTDDAEWKDSLQPGDLLDSCDEYGVWYRSTLFKRYEQDKYCEGNPI